MEAAYRKDKSKCFENGMIEARNIQKLCETHPRFVGYVAHCDIKKGANYLNEFLDKLRDENGKLSPFLKGVRIVIYRMKPGEWYTQDFKDALDVLRPLGLMFEITICLGTLEDALQMLKDFPDNKFVLCHAGASSLGEYENCEDYYPLISEIAKCKNIVVKLGGHEEWSCEPKPVMLHCIKEFGYDRCLAESNWFMIEGFGGTVVEPMQLLMQYCQELGATQEQLDMVFFKNAERWYDV